MDLNFTLRPGVLLYFRLLPFGDLFYIYIHTIFIWYKGKLIKRKTGLIISLDDILCVFAAMNLYSLKREDLWSKLLVLINGTDKDLAIRFFSSQYNPVQMVRDLRI